MHLEADDLPGKEWTEAELEEQRLSNIRKMFRSQSNVKIGCCNGLPYNSSKRCCCRRIPFDKDKKFCCAIDVRQITAVYELELIFSFFFRAVKTSKFLIAQTHNTTKIASHSKVSAQWKKK